MNSRQRRACARRVWGDHYRWPLGTVVIVKAGHHSADAVGLQGSVMKHGFPCVHKRDCIVEFDHGVADATCYDVKRSGHYVQFRHLKRVIPAAKSMRTARKMFVSTMGRKQTKLAVQLAVERYGSDYE